MCILFFLSFSFSVFSISFIFFLSVFPKYPLSIFIPFARMVKVVQFHSALCLFIIIFISTIIHLIDEWMKGWTLEFRWFGRLSFFLLLPLLLTLSFIIFVFLGNITFNLVKELESLSPNSCIIQWKFERFHFISFH